jgi:hypothetical protein
MAALPVSRRQTPPVSCSGSPVALALGLVALITGAALLLSGLLLPISPSHPIEIPDTAVIPTPAVRFDAAEDAAVATGAPPFLRFGPVTTLGHCGMDQSPPVLPEADVQSRARTATGCLWPEVTRGAHADPTHPATIPLCRDPCDDLAMLAATQYRECVSDACPCLMGVPSNRLSLGNSDDRIAHALFGAASSLDVVPCVQEDLRRDLAHVGPFPMSGRIAAEQNALMEIAAAPYLGPLTRWDGTGAPAPQAAGAAETVLLVEPIGPPQEGRSSVYSRIDMRPHARWEADLDAGPLTLFVQHGRVGLVLDDGSAHVEVDDLLFGKRSDPVSPGSRIVLRPGDRLIVSRGRHLRVDNDDATLAIIYVWHLQQPPHSVIAESE